MKICSKYSCILCQKSQTNIEMKPAVKHFARAFRVQMNQNQIRDARIRYKVSKRFTSVAVHF